MKLIPKCKDNSGNALGNIGDNVDYLKIFNNLYDEYGDPISKDDFRANWIRNASEYEKEEAKLEIEDLLNSGYHYLETPETTITAVAPLRIKTYYPGNPRYLIGHSQILRKGKTPTSVSKTMQDPDYNLVTNNCSDNTMEALNYTFGTNESANVFTTPGDTRDFALTLKGAKLAEDGSGDIIIPVTEDQAKQFDAYALWNLQRLSRQKRLTKRVKGGLKNGKSDKYLTDVKKEFDSYTHGNPERTPIKNENYITNK